MYRLLTEMLACRRRKIVVLKFLFPLFCFYSLANAGHALELTPHQVEISSVRYKGLEAIRVMESAVSTAEDKIAIITKTQMTNGVISGCVAGDVGANAGPRARGFVGIAFRIAEDVSSFEAIYLRPANARAQDQLRRNHSVQYISFPEFPWHKLRKETPGRYESYADMALGDWIHYRLEVHGDVARLFLDNADHPALIVNDLKLGERSGAVGLWIGPGTEAHFTNITIEKARDREPKSVSCEIN